MPTLSQVKDILWITNSLQDTTLQAILDSGVVLANDMVDITAGEKSIFIHKYMDEIHFTCPNVTQITEIDWVDFTDKVIGTDYILKPNGTAQVLYLRSYVSTPFDSYLVKYNAGYEEEPADYVMAIAQFVWDKLKVVSGEVKKEELWPRSVEFVTSADGGSLWMTPERKLMLALQQYIPLNLRYW